MSEHDPAVAADRAWATVAHLGGLLTSVVVPAAVVALGRRRPFVQAHAAEALNFQLTVLLALVASLMAFAVVLGPVLLVLVIVWAVIAPLVAASRALAGLDHRYPLTLRFVRVVVSSRAGGATTTFLPTGEHADDRRVPGTSHPGDPGYEGRPPSDDGAVAARSERPPRT